MSFLDEIDEFQPLSHAFLEEVSLPILHEMNASPGSLYAYRGSILQERVFYHIGESWIPHGFPELEISLSPKPPAGVAAEPRSLFAIRTSRSDVSEVAPTPKFFAESSGEPVKLSELEYRYMEAVIEFVERLESDRRLMVVGIPEDSHGQTLAQDSITQRFWRLHFAIDFSQGVLWRPTRRLEEGWFPVFSDIRVGAAATVGLHDGAGRKTWNDRIQEILPDCPEALAVTEGKSQDVKKAKKELVKRLAELGFCESVDSVARPFSRYRNGK